MIQLQLVRQMQELQSATKRTLPPISIPSNAPIAPPRSAPSPAPKQSGDIMLEQSSEEVIVLPISAVDAGLLPSNAGLELWKKNFYLAIFKFLVNVLSSIPSQSSLHFNLYSTQFGNTEFLYAVKLGLLLFFNLVGRCTFVHNIPMKIELQAVRALL